MICFGSIPRSTTRAALPVFVTRLSDFLSGTEGLAGDISLAVDKFELCFSLFEQAVIHMAGFPADSVLNRKPVLCRLIPTCNGCPFQRPSSGSDSTCTGLGMDLPAAFFHFAVESSIQVGIGFAGVVMVVTHRPVVAVEGIEFTDFGAVWFFEPVNGVAIQSVGHGEALAQDFLKVERGDVVVVVIRPAGVASVVVQFACEIGVGATVVLDGVKNGDPIGGKGNGAAEKMRLG